MAGARTERGFRVGRQRSFLRSSDFIPEEAGPSKWRRKLVLSVLLED